MSRAPACRFPTVLPLAAALAFMLGAAPADAAEGGIFSGLLPAPGSELGAAELAAFAAGAPLVLSGFESQGGGSALGDAAFSPDGKVTILSSAASSATVAGSPVSLGQGGRIVTGSFEGDITMENGSGLAGAQLASGFNNIQQNTVSFVFVLSGLPE